MFLRQRILETCCRTVAGLFHHVSYVYLILICPLYIPVTTLATFEYPTCLMLMHISHNFRFFISFTSVSFNMVNEGIMSCSSGQILLPRYVMNVLNNFCKTEYLRGLLMT